MSSFIEGFVFEISKQSPRLSKAAYSPVEMGKRVAKTIKNTVPIKGTKSAPKSPTT